VPGNVSFLFNRFLSSRAAFTPGPVTAWRGVTGPGVPPLEAEREALVLAADQCGRRLLAGRTRATAALSDERRRYAIRDPKRAEQREVLVLLAQDAMCRSLALELCQQDAALADVALHVRRGPAGGS
jgi:hypothetical protein